MYAHLKYLVIGIVLCITTDEQQVPPRQAEQTYKVLDEMDGALLLDGVNVDGGPFGLHISNLSRACVGKELLVSAKLLKNDPEFKLRICEKLTSPTSCFEAYVVLNALYNEHALHIVDGMIFVNPDNTRTTIPVKILSGNTLITADLSQHSFSEVCRHYWESKLGVKSEQQRLWEESIERDSKR